MTLRLTRLDQSLPIADATGLPTQQFMRFQQKDKEAIEQAFASLETQLSQILAAQTAAAAADAKAEAAGREAARINSYTIPTNVLTAADTGSDATITVAGHTRVYPVQGALDVPDIVVSGGAIPGLAFSTLYYVYYDDTTLEDTTPSYQATTNSATSQVGAAAGRHFVGAITTPADGGGGSTGSGGTPPGGGGGNPIP